VREWTPVGSMDVDLWPDDVVGLSQGELLREGATIFPLA